MPKVNDVGERATKWIRWTARIWGTLIVAFTLLFFIGYAWNLVTTGVADPHAVEDYPPIENLPPLFAFLSVRGVGLAWRWEGVGGGIAGAVCLAYLAVRLIHWPIADDFPRYLVAPYGVWMVIAIPGVLYLICWWRSRKGDIAEHGA